MRSIKKFLFFPIVFFASTAFGAECAHEYRKNNGLIYQDGQLSEFIGKEIRPELSNDERLFTVQIKSTCSNKPVVNLMLKMSSKNYYILGINGQDLPRQVVDYNNRLALEINSTNFYMYITEAAQQNFLRFPEPNSAISYADKKELIRQQKILKMFAFVFAEAARFESIEVAVKRTIDGKCTVDWHDYDYAVHNWKNISTFILDRKIKSVGQIAGGGNDQLVVPVKIEQEMAFDAALMKGDKYDYSSAAPLLDQYSYDECSIQ